MKDIFTHNHYLPKKHDFKNYIILVLVFITLFTTFQYNSINTDYQTIKAKLDTYQTREPELFKYIIKLESDIKNIAFECTNFMTDDETVDFQDYLDEQKKKNDKTKEQLIKWVK